MTTKKVSELPSLGTMTGSDLLLVVDVSEGTSKKATVAQVVGLTITGVGADPPLSSSGGLTPTISLTGTVSVGNGGTGRNTLTDNNVVVGNGTGQVKLIAPNATGDVLTWNGTSWTSAPPSGGGGGGGVSAVTATLPLLSSGGAFPTISIQSGTNPDDVLKWSGSAWVSSPPPAAGVSSVGASPPLSVSGPASTPTVSLGTVGADKGGTGVSFLPINNVLLGNGTDPVQAISPGAAGNVLTSNGTTWSSQPPSGGGGGTVTSVGFSTTLSGLSVSGTPVTTAGTLSLSGTLGADSGGTGRSTLTANHVLVGDGTGQVKLIAPVNVNDYLKWNGTEWVSAPVAGVSGGTVTSVGTTPGTTGLTLTASPNPITASGTLSIGGILNTGAGGTGVNTLTAGRVLVGGGGTNPVQLVGGTTPGDVLTWSGSAWAAAAAPGGISAVAGSTYIDAATSGSTVTVSIQGLIPVANGGTGAANKIAAFDALAPTGSKGDLIVHNGTDNTRLPASTTNNDVLIVDSAHATGLKWGKVPLTNVTGTLAVSSGGTGAITLTGYVKGSGTTAFTASATIPGSDVTGNISGNAANVTGIVPVSNGGTGVNTLVGYVKASGTAAFTASATIPGSSVTGNISGNAANVTGIVPVSNGGTGGTTQATAQSGLGVPSTTGAGATGTWPIAISGNAATVTLAASGGASTNYIPFSTTSTGSSTLLTDASRLQFDASTDTLGVRNITLGQGSTSGSCTLGGTTGSDVVIKATEGTNILGGGYGGSFRVSQVTNGGTTYETLVMLQSGGASPTGGKTTFLHSTVFFTNIVSSAAGTNAAKWTGTNQLLKDSSSIRYKTDVEDVEESRSEAVLLLRPRWYRSNCDVDRKDWSFYGFIAEEVAAIEPRLATYEPDPEDASKDRVSGVAYDRVPVLLLDVVKRQRDRINAQETKINDLEARLAALEALVRG